MLNVGGGTQNILNLFLLGGGAQNILNLFLLGGGSQNIPNLFLLGGGGGHKIYSICFYFSFYLFCLSPFKFCGRHLFYKLS